MQIPFSLSQTWANGAKYEGQWENGVRNGKGLYLFTPRGTSSYEGDFVENKREGVGVYQWGSGDRYSGGFLNDQRHGKGVIEWASSRLDVCRFEEGKMVGEGVRWSADRTTAWRTLDGNVVGGEISVDEAQQIEESLNAEPEATAPVAVEPPPKKK